MEVKRKDGLVYNIKHEKEERNQKGKETERQTENV